MKNLKEKVSYLKGLAEGMQINDSTNEGKLLKAIIDMLDDVALAVDDMQELQEELSEQVENIDEDLAEVEGIIFDEEKEDDCCIGEIECPHCNKEFCIDDEMFDSEAKTIKCPNCQEDIEVEWECDCDNCSDDDCCDDDKE